VLAVASEETSYQSIYARSGVKRQDTIKLHYHQVTLLMNPGGSGGATFGIRVRGLLAGSEDSSETPRGEIMWCMSVVTVVSVTVRSI